MLIDFFYSLRAAKLPVSVKEYLMLLDALRQEVIPPSIDAFYYLARMTLVKDEQYFDRFDQAFGRYFHGVAALPAEAFEIPADWLEKKLQRELTAEEKAQIEALGGLDKLMERLRELFDEQKARHEGGNKWIGTGGTSPFGHGGYNPEGIRIGGPSNGNRTALKVWEARAYRDYDDSVELGTRNIKVALRRLRRFAREGGGRPARPARHHPQHGRQCRLARPAHGARAAQQGEGADAARRGRLDGRPHRAHRGAVLGGQGRVQAPGVLLLPQLRLRLPVEEQPASPRRAHAHLGRDPQVQRRLQADLRGRRHHEPL